MDQLWILQLFSKRRNLLLNGSTSYLEFLKKYYLGDHIINGEMKVQQESSEKGIFEKKDYKAEDIGYK